MNTPTKCVLFSQIRDTLKQIKERDQVLEGDRKDEEVLESISVQISKEKSDAELRHLKNQISLKDGTIEELRDKVSSLEKSDLQRQSKEFRRLVQTVSEKEVEIDNLNRINNRQKSKIQSLETEIASLTSSKALLQTSILKSIEQIKNECKGTASSAEDVELERYIIENKCRQIDDKLEFALKLQIDLQNKKKNLEQQVRKAKSENQELFQRNMDLQMEVQALKSSSKRSPSNSIAKFSQRNCPSYSQRPIQGAVEGEMELLKQVIGGCEQIITLNRRVDSVEDTLAEKQALLKKIDVLVDQNQKYESEIVSLRSQCEERPFRENLVADNYPSVFSFLQAKQTEIARFDQTLLKIEEELESRVSGFKEAIESKEFFEEKPQKCQFTQEEFEELNSKKVHLEAEIKAMRFSLNLCKEEVSSLESEMQSLRREFETEKGQMVKQLKAFEEQVQKLKAQNSNLMVRSTGSASKSTKSNEDSDQLLKQKQLLALKELLGQRDEELSETRIRLNFYKADIESLVKEGKPINEKQRCAQCLLSLLSVPMMQEGQQKGKCRCQHCKRELHSSCVGSHKQKCKAQSTKPLRKSKPRTKAVEKKRSKSKREAKDYFD